MHMADALISPAVGGAAWAATAGLIGYSSRKLRKDLDDKRVPLMGVMGAFVFAAQMVNFTIPATGSSGHLGGGLILAILLGPFAGFLTLASVLVIQALFFADGGLLALGCNIFNLGFFPCFIAYPLIYRKMAGTHQSNGRIATAAMISAVVGLQLGSLAVVTQTWLSGISELRFATFTLVMQPIHLAIGIVEGLATVTVVLFVLKARPEILIPSAPHRERVGSFSIRRLALVFLAAAVIAGGGLSLVASQYPDGLEWSIHRVSGTEELSAPSDGLHGSLSAVQDRTALMPDYAPRPETGGGEEEEHAAWWGTTLSGLVGGGLTLLLAGAMWLVVRRRSNTCA